jgi:cobalt ECF transporter T component CbiQ
MARASRQWRRGLIERTLRSLLDAMGQALEAEYLAQRPGLLQELDPRVKLIAALALILAALLARRVAAIVVILLSGVALAVLSHIPLRLLAKRVWLGALSFTGLLAVPALFFTPGSSVASLPVLGWPVTAQGVHSAALLIARVEAAATLSVLVILTTPWNHVLKALRVLKAPVVVVVLLGMTYRYILLLLETAHGMFEARQSRTVGRLDGRESRRLAAATAGVLMERTLELSGDVYMAMRSRGFAGEVYLLDDFEVRARDWIALTALLTLAAAVFWAGK